MMARTPLGPMLRAVLRRSSGFGSMMLEVAFGLAVVSTSLGLASWYRDGASRPTPIDLAHTFTIDIERETAAGEELSRVEGERQFLGQFSGVTGVAQIERAPFVPPMGFDLLYAAPGHGEIAWSYPASPNLVELLGLRPIAGRLLEPADEVATATVPVVISRALAQAVFGTDAPIGRIARSQSRAEPFVVVGVVDNAPISVELAPRPQQVLFRAMSAGAPWRRTKYIVSTEATIGPSFAAELTAALQQSGATWARARSLEETRAEANQNAPGAYLILSKLAWVVIALALMSSLGMSAFLVGLRSRQIGIMRALGATRSDVARYFLIENFVVTSVGIALGALASHALVTLTQRIDPSMVLDRKYILEGAILFWLVGLAAAAVPALAASRIAPGSRP